MSLEPEERVLEKSDEWDKWPQWLREHQRIDINGKRFVDGQPCSHPGCFHHITHPCEGCGRIGGRYISTDIPWGDLGSPSQ